MASSIVGTPAVGAPALRRSLKKAVRPCRAQKETAGEVDAGSTKKTSGMADMMRDLSKSFRSAPRVRVKSQHERTSEQIADLVVLNERLRGANPVAARMRLEQIRKDRETWDRVTSHILKRDAVATMEEIEILYRAVEVTLKEQREEKASIGELNEELGNLQDQLETARAKLDLTTREVAQNVARVAALEEQATELSTSFAAQASDAILAASERSSDPRASEFAVAVEPAALGPASARAREAELATPTPLLQGLREKKAPKKKGSDIGLHSSMDLEPALKEMWLPIAFSAHVKEGEMQPFELFDEPWVLFRGADGQVGCLQDTCAHRACPLSLGKVQGNAVMCAYHGWEFEADGACTKMPSTRHCKGVSVKSLPVAEEGGFVWAYPGDEPPPPTRPVEDISPPGGYKVHAEICIDVPVEHGLLIENLLDLAHAPFTHVNTFAKGWPIPDAVKFQTNRLLGGDWHPYPIKMSFEPPCMTLSTIGLDAPGKPVRGSLADDCDKHLHQLHVCIPAKRGHTRLLYRMSMDFLGWMQGLPFTDRLWKGYADAVLGEDLVLVLGQQDRLERGGNTWNLPVSYDKMAVRYRRWRNKVAAEGVPRPELEASDAADTDSESPLEMTSGELFRLEMEGEDGLPLN